MVMDMDWHYQDWGHNEGEPYALFGYGHAGQNLGWTGYTWNKKLFPDYAAFLKYLHDNNLRTSLNLHPAQGVRCHEEMFEESEI